MQNRFRFLCRLVSLSLVVSANGTACTASAHSDGGTRDLDASGSQIAVLRADMQPDPKIAAALRGVDPEAIHRDIAGLVAFRNRSTLSSMTPNLPPHTGVTAAADWVFAQYSAISKECGGCLEVKRDTFTEQPMSRIPVPTTITNVYAVLKGTEPGNRAVLVTGHYDSRNTTNENTTDEAPGANDDASGVAVSLASARALSRMRFPATIIFAAVASEEQGLNGSRHLAKMLKSENVALEAVLNNDIVGGNTTPGDTLQDKKLVRVFSEGIPATATPEQLRAIQLLGYESDSPSRELARTVADVAAEYFPVQRAGALDRLAGSTPVQPVPALRPVLEMRRDRFLRGGDHTAFNAEGFAAVRFTEWREDFNHQHQNVRVENGVQYGDLIRYVDMQYVAQVARLNTATLASLASAPAAPVEVKVVADNLDNSTTLKWKPGAETPAGTHYQVLWRELAASDWEYGAEAAKFGSDGTATLPVSKDNVIFGLRAVDADGHASVAVTPYPLR